MGIFRLTQQHDQISIEISPDYKRYDERNHTIYRAFWDPELTPWAEKFYAMRMGEKRSFNNPGFTDIDVALARGAWIICEETRGAYGATDRGFYSWDKESFPRQAVFSDPAKTSQAVKHAAKFLGASLVGIADYDERWVYTHSFNPFTQAHVPIEFPVQPKSVVVIAIEMNYLNYRTNPSFISSAATAKGYGDMAIVAYRVATFIRALGYHAFPCHNDIALSVPLAIQAGLGEMSRLGLVVTPEYGPRVRLCKVFTDMPLEPDRPITFGVVEFCKKCMKCADVCPARAISNDPEPSYKTVGYSNNPGVKKWYNKLEGCLKFWADKVDCAACIAVCPYNKPNNLTHQLGLRIAQTPARGLLRRLDSLLGYGKTFDKKLMRNWWPVNPLDQSEASERPRRVTDENDLGWIKLNDTTRLPEVLAALNVKLNSQPERLAGVNMTVQFVFTGECGGPRYLLIRDSKAEISEGHNTNASTTITVKDSDFLLLIQGKLSPLAIVSGRVKVEGDMSIIPKFRNLMR